MPRQTKPMGPRKRPLLTTKDQTVRNSAVLPPFEQNYPTIAQWVKSDGWIEIGRDDGFRTSIVRALDPGGLIWESDEDYATFDALLSDLENGTIRNGLLFCNNRRFSEKL